MLELVRRRRLTVDGARALIQVCRRDLRALVAAGISRHVIRSALDFRRKVLTAFDKEVPNMKLLDNKSAPEGKGPAEVSSSRDFSRARFLSHGADV